MFVCLSLTQTQTQTFINPLFFDIITQNESTGLLNPLFPCASIIKNKMENTQSVILNKTERPNSYEFGKAGNRFKIYFEDVKDLQKIMAELKAAQLYIEEGAA